MNALTDWFPKHITPAHVGAYEVRLRQNGKIVKWYSWWTGSRWSRTALTPEGAESCKHHISALAITNEGFEWRGQQEQS
jgi:hypothetical protein